MLAVASCSSGEPAPSSGTAHASAAVVDALAVHPALAGRIGRGGALARRGDGFGPASAPIAWVAKSPAFGATQPEMRLSAQAGARADAPSRLAAVLEGGREAWVELTDPSARQVNGERVEGALVFRDAHEGSDEVLVPEPGRFEQLRLVRAPTDRVAMRQQLRLGGAARRARVVEGFVEILDDAGVPRLHAAPAFAIDARGVSRAMTTTITDAPDGPTVEWSLDARGLSFPVAVDPVWTTTGQLAVARGSIDPVRLTGGDVLVCGGNDGANQLSTCERYSATTRTWSATGSLKLGGRAEHQSIALADGTALTFGGADALGNITSTAELYDPTTGTNTQVGNMSSQRRGGKALLDGNNRPVIWGGRNASALTFDIYDPATKTWSALAPPGGGNLTWEYAAIAGADKTLYFIGGNTDSGVPINQNITYKANVGGPGATVVQRTRMPLEARWVVGGLLPDGDLIVAGGAYTALDGTLAPSSYAFRYHPATDSWKQAGSLASPHAWAFGTSLKDGRFMLANGLSVFNPVTPSYDAELYDYATDTWTSAGKTSVPHMLGGIVTLLDGDVLDIAGAAGIVGIRPTYSQVVDRFHQNAVGAVCTTDAECSSGFCVDGRCCGVSASACAGSCQACDVAGKEGTCSAVTGAPHAGHASCAGGYACNAGACRIGCGGDADCDAASHCVSGACAPRLGNGKTCASSSECLTGNCVDGTCCDAPCGGLCQACDLPGKKGTCSPTVGAPHGTRGSCGGLGAGTTCGTQCDGVDVAACHYPGVSTPCSATACTSGYETHPSFCDGGGACKDVPISCGAYACDAIACKKSCATRSDCAAGYTCKGASCVPFADLGVACASGTDCASGFCTDGVCCGSQSCGAGSSCALDAHKGTCAKVQGASCAIDAECGTGHCVDGVCCESACGGQCQACDVPGQLGKCVAAKGKPHGTRAACAKGTDPCSEALCDGTDGTKCAAFVGAEVSCRDASCASGAATAAASCNGSGACPAATTTSCGAYACDGAACRTTCSTTNDCAKGYACDAGACQPHPTSCSDDLRSMITTDGKTTDCAPYLCRGDKCPSSCVSTGDCAAGYACDTDGTCVPAVQPSSSSDGGGCALGAPGDSHAASGARGLAGVALAIVVAARARRRRSARGGTR
jgi:hypothetical protein